jgi:hypothetical protein
MFALMTDAFAGFIFTLDFCPAVGFMAPNQRRNGGREKENNHKSG